MFQFLIKYSLGVGAIAGILCMPFIADAQIINLVSPSYSNQQTLQTVTTQCIASSACTINFDSDVVIHSIQAEIFEPDMTSSVNDYFSCTDASLDSDEVFSPLNIGANDLPLILNPSTLEYQGQYSSGVVDDWCGMQLSVNFPAGAINLTVSYFTYSPIITHSCYDVTGFGDSAANGVYKYFEDFNGQPGYVNENNSAYYLYYGGGPFSGYDYWIMSDVFGLGDIHNYFQKVTSPNYDPTTAAGAWSLNEGYGVDPAGTVSLFPCSETTDAGLSTTTPLYVQSDTTYHDTIFLAAIIIFLLTPPWLREFFAFLKRKKSTVYKK